jgi:hypothetical protein
MAATATNVLEDSVARTFGPGPVHPLIMVLLWNNKTIAENGINFTSWVDEGK